MLVYDLFSTSATDSSKRLNLGGTVKLTETDFPEAVQYP